MHQRVRALKAADSGFTLIELLIVIVIIGVLASVVVLAVSGVTDRGKTSACKAEVHTVEVADEAYFAKTGDYAKPAANTVTILQGAGFLSGSSDYKDTDVAVTITAGPPESINVAGGSTGPCA